MVAPREGDARTALVGAPVRDGTAASSEAERMGRLARPVAEAGWAEVERLGLA